MSVQLKEEDFIIIKDICDFLAYVIVANEQIDNRELNVINKLIEANEEFSETLENSTGLIFADSDQKEPLNKIINRLKNLSFEEQESIINLSLQIAYSDGYYDPAEEEVIVDLIDRLNFDINRYKNLKELAADGFQPDSNTVELHPLLKKFNPIARRMAQGIKVVAPTENIKQKADKLDKKLLLGGPEYSKAIERCAKIANEDFKFVKRYLKENSTELKRLENNLDRLVSKLSKEQEVEEFDIKTLLTNLQEKVDSILISRLEKNKESLYKKKRAMNNYTISFLGKTKAGKSTVHSIITGEGSEFIGVGKQRTTRYNRVYSWNNIRIIDTPGIGAPGGKSDEEIAKSIVDESDVICYIVKNDSIQEAEFKFLKLIKEKNKPVIILLNVKENLKDPRRLKVYLKRPQRWYKTKGKKSLQGHINRIRKYAKKHYENDYFNIYPVQLLAAQMSREDQYQEHTNLLYNSSRIQEFLDELRISIVEEGILKRSQTMIDGTLNVFNETFEKLKDFKKPIVKMKEKLVEKENKLSNKLDKMCEEYNSRLQNGVKSEFNKLDDKAYTFANNNCEKSEDKIKEEWTNYLNNIGFEDGLGTTIERLITEYIDEIEEYLEEVTSDILAFNRLEFNNLEVLNTDMFNFNSLLKGLLKGGVAGVITGVITAFAFASNPIGWFVGGIAGLAGLIKSLFKSKAQKRKEATEKLYNSLSDGISNQKDKAIKKIEEKFIEFHNEVEISINNYFDVMIHSLDKVINQINPLIESLEDQIKEMDQVFAWRVVNYAVNKNKVPIKIDFDKVKEEIIDIDRKQGKYFSIKYKHKVTEDISDDISHILQEKTKIMEGQTNDRRKI